MVTDKERKKWWGDGAVFLYVFEFYPFKYTMKYNKTPGQTTFFGEVDIVDENKAPSEDKNEDAKAQKKIANTPKEDLGKGPVVPVSPLSV